MANENLSKAKAAKNDEFYTQYSDIEKEMNAYLECDPDVFRGKTVLLPCDDPEWSNFTKYFAQNYEFLGLKKIISTSYAPNSKPIEVEYQPGMFETDSPIYDEGKSKNNGKVFTVTQDISGDGKVDFKDFEWEYLKGDGDFRSDEVKALRDEADVVVTNPPFSLFREFLAWVVEAGKQFVIIGNMNAITYKETFPLIQSNRMWIGATNFNVGMYFLVPPNFTYALTYKCERVQNGVPVNRVPGVCWYTNIDHGRRHEPLPLMTEADNIKFSKHANVKDFGYQKYVNYDAIEVPFTDAIPSDYEGVMGVPITFLDKYNTEQFEIVGCSDDLALPMSEFAEKGTYSQGGPRFYLTNEDGKYSRVYTRIVIKHRSPSK